MSENFKIGSFICSTQSVYEVLKDLNLNDTDLKEIDLNGDNKISEDELVEFSGVDDTDNTSKKTSGASSEMQLTEEIDGEYSDDATIQNLQIQRDNAVKELRKLKVRLKKLEFLKKTAEANAAGYEKDSSAKSTAESTINSFQSKIDNVNNSISSCVSKIASLNMQIEQTKYTKSVQAQAQAQAAAQAAAQAQQTTGTGQVANTGTVVQTTNGTNATNSIQVQSGSGADLANVTGDLSICLDRMASSLGMDRQSAADYVATVCQTAGAGYFDPKTIVSLVFSESGGDNTASSDPNYVGFGQMSAVAVDEVNNQFGTNFTFADMSNPAKNLEALTYLLRFQYERYGHDLGKALTAYNVGNCESGVINGYAQGIMART